ncbi:MAG: hypothetical protein Kow0069_13940 [Promethearchaeota archaeon]
MTSEGEGSNEIEGKRGGVTYPAEVVDEFVEQLDFSKLPGGLVPVVAQDASNGEVLMVAFANEAAVRETLSSGLATYWSRSRGELWQKGRESGHVQLLRDVLVDCYADTVVYVVEQKVAACHTGYRTCFYRHLSKRGLELRPGQRRLFDPREVYG